MATLFQKKKLLFCRFLIEIENIYLNALGFIVSSDQIIEDVKMMKRQHTWIDYCNYGGLLDMEEYNELYNTIKKTRFYRAM